MYKEKRRVMYEVERRTAIIHDVHEGTRDNLMAKALEAHRGCESTNQKLSEQYFWHGILKTLRNILKFVNVANNKGRSFRISVQS